MQASPNVGNVPARGGMSTNLQPGRLLQGSIFTPNALSADAKALFLDSIWPRSSLSKTSSTADFDAYFAYLRQEVNRTDPDGHIVNSYNDIVWVITLVSRSPTEKLADLQSTIQTAHPRGNEQKVSASLELSLRLWLLINVRILMPADTQDMHNSLPWPKGQCLQEVLSRVIVSSTNNIPGQLGAGSGKFSVYLNVADMKRIAGYRIVWTNRLLDHLDTEGSSIYMFHHVSVLKRLKESLPRNLLPPAYFDETLATIKLMIPHSQPGCNAWLEGQISQYSLDANVRYRESANRDKDGYAHWHHRLSLIAETFDMTGPSTFRQWWYDRRNMERWWGFWLLVIGVFLAVLFGLIQSVTGILQVLKD
ncbi:uncharacterized protein PG986_014538 [Apiospora aurea]|uniref:Uncharacterized protein n=1 Tax=Apiospora aurea TaxID=335848 RepID=A0ABR1PT94_9PEZI